MDFQKSIKEVHPERTWGGTWVCLSDSKGKLVLHTRLANARGAKRIRLSDGQKTSEVEPGAQVLLQA